MSNLTSASGEACISTENGGFYPSDFQPPPPLKRKRSQPGHPDPDAEVIALSPTTLLATNRFVCEVCNKGFQRDQNLQLHRRGHNLPWKLKQRANKEVRKKAYVCPETTCVHHHPSRALGDLTGIKKHFCRKHGEKKWKCEKCSKKYAVLSDWKAHSKSCGTREYRCHCGTLFSRRDSFITHRAFCDALAEETTVSIAKNSLQLQEIQSHFSNQTGPPPFSVKKEQQNFISGSEVPLPPWLFSFCPPPSSIFQSFQPSHDFQAQHFCQSHPPAPPAEISAGGFVRAQQTHVSAGEAGPGGATSSGLHLLSSRDELISGLASCGSSKDAFFSAGGAERTLTANLHHHHQHHHPPSFIQDLIINHPGFGDIAAFPEFLTHQIPSKKDEKVFNFHVNTDGFNCRNEGNHDGTTRDFLGLSHCEILNLAGLNNCVKLSDSDELHQNHKPWQS